MNKAVQLYGVMMFATLFMFVVAFKATLYFGDVIARFFY